jgi:PRD1 phage membrane DNA delivery
MSDQLITALVSIVLGLVGLAALATVLSPQAQTAGVINAGAGGLATDLKAATAPVSGGGLGGLTALPQISTPGNGI